MVLIDKKFRRHKAQFLLQCLLATIAVLVVLIILNAIASAAVVAALGATAFIVFASPGKKSSTPKVIIGAYLIGLAVGTACHWPGQLEPHASAAVNRNVTLAAGAVAVGIAMFLMAVTNTEHPPAVGVALGLAIGHWAFETVAVVIVGVIVLCIVRWLLRSWLTDLL